MTINRSVYHSLPRRQVDSVLLLQLSPDLPLRDAVQIGRAQDLLCRQLQLKVRRTSTFATDERTGSREFRQVLAVGP